MQLKPLEIIRYKTAFSPNNWAVYVGKLHLGSIALNLNRTVNTCQYRFKWLINLGSIKTPPENIYGDDVESLADRALEDFRIFINSVLM